MILKFYFLSKKHSNIHTTFTLVFYTKNIFLKSNDSIVMSDINYTF